MKSDIFFCDNFFVSQKFQNLGTRVHFTKKNYQQKKIIINILNSHFGQFWHEKLYIMFKKKKEIGISQVPKVSKLYRSGKM